MFLHNCIISYSGGKMIVVVQLFLFLLGIMTGRGAVALTIKKSWSGSFLFDLFMSINTKWLSTSIQMLPFIRKEK